jgi:hypothetical protein
MRQRKPDTIDVFGMHRSKFATCTRTVTGGCLDRPCHRGARNEALVKIAIEMLATVIDGKLFRLSMENDDTLRFRVDSAILDHLTKTCFSNVR